MATKKDSDGKIITHGIMIWNKPKKSYLIKEDIRTLILALYEMQRMTTSSNTKDAYGYVISELKNILDNN